MTQPPASDANADVASLSFDEAYAELQSAVAALEAGGTPLETMLAQHERAVALQRHCDRLLSDAELRVQQLLARPGSAPVAVDVVPDEAEEA